MRAYGNEKIHTPHMDRLAAQSFVFETAYVTQPVCTPSRSSILTGLYPHANGCVKNNQPLVDSVPCLPELCDFTVYHTGYVGKWHLGDEIFPQHGFSEWVGIDDNYRKHYAPERDRSAHSDYYHFLIKNGFTPDLTEEDGYPSFSREYCARLPEPFSKASFVGDQAGRFIEKHREEPFVLYVNFFEPHMPYFSARDAQYPPEEMPLPDNFAHEPGEDAPLKTRLYRAGYAQKGHSGLPLKTDADWQKMIAHYWGMVSLVDQNVGKILDQLERCGLAEDTVVVYTSDHGDMMGSHGLLAKCVMFDEAAKVPLLLKIPGMTPDGRRITRPVSQIDLVPTLLDILDKQSASILHGQSLLPYLSGQRELEEKNVFLEWNGPNSGFGSGVASIEFSVNGKSISSQELIQAISVPVRTIVTESGWKYNWSLGQDDELYNLIQDPRETENLVALPQNHSRISSLRALIQAWQRRVNDPLTANYAQMV